MNIDILLKAVEDRGGSDLILKANAEPLCRVRGSLEKVAEHVLRGEQVEQLVREVCTESQFARFQQEKELDLAYQTASGHRFRTNVFRQRGTLAMAMRSVPTELPSMAEIGLPTVAQDLAMRPRGLLLVTGPAGCGKSTTQAALIDYRNANDDCHIMTVEDPIEFVHQDKKSMVNQRQVGRDTHSFANGLKYVLRQDPDVILIGEMRDLETISLAITAAETGHLAIGTLHTTDAGQTIDRVINAFPAHQQQQIKMQLSVNLIAVISQVLVHKKDDPGRLAAFEILLATSAVRNLIREAKTHQISNVLQTARPDSGMVSMERSLSELVQQGVIDPEEALSKAPRPEELTNLVGACVAAGEKSLYL